MNSESPHILLARNVLVRGLDDWVQAYEVVGEIVESGIPVTDVGVPDLSIAILEYLLLNQLMVAGDVTEGGFHAWNQTPEAALHTIKTRWSKLDGLPNLGDVCWLNNTTLGDEIGRTQMQP